MELYLVNRDSLLYDIRNKCKCIYIITAFYRFGGAIAMRPSDFKAVNGFSNKQQCNDGDYIEMYHRYNTS